MNNRKTYTLCLSRQRITLARRAAALRILMMETPYGERYASRRDVLTHHAAAIDAALDHQATTNAARFKMATREAFTFGHN